MKTWTITVEDTGEKIIMSVGKHTHSWRYNPEGGQNLEIPDRDETIGEAFAYISDLFDEEEEPDGEGQEGRARRDARGGQQYLHPL